VGTRRPDRLGAASGVRRHDEQPAESPEGGVYTFVPDGIESALEQAKASAGDKAVGVMGGASIGHQYLAAGLVDGIRIHLVPVFFGSGIRMFEHLGDEHSAEIVEVTNTREAVHLHFRIVK
jgi:dihydrofolate reductase